MLSLPHRRLLCRALPAGVPTLDEMAGDWKTPAELEQFPSIHNFDGQMLVNKDLASISWLASPPFSQGFHSGALRLDGKVPVAEKFRWYPYQAVRSGAWDGLAIETVNRMVFDARGVLWHITVSNTQPAARERQALAGSHWGHQQADREQFLGLGLRPARRGRPKAAL